MKNRKSLGLLCLALCLPILFACDKIGGGESQSKTENMERMYVDVNYDEETRCVSYSVNNVLSSSMNLTLHSKKSNNIISNVVAGDYLEVYYEDEDKTLINEAKVDEASIVEISLTKKCPPGSHGEEVDLITQNNESDIIIRRNDIEFVINEDQSFTSIYEIEDDTPLHGVYRQEEVFEYESTGVFVYTLAAIYSYSPRLA